MKTLERRTGWGGGWAAAAVIGALACVGGCHSAPKAVEYARTYPPAQQGETLNIQVIRHTKTVELTNTTARAFGPSTLWINARFSRPIEGLGIGESVTLPLKDFRDEFSVAFRGGGFFAPEPPERIVMAQIETPGSDGKQVMLGMVVVRGEPE